jgi:hypothetical protein
MKPNKVVCKTRCPKCWEQLLFSDLHDPDLVIMEHLKGCKVGTKLS